MQAGRLHQGEGFPRFSPFTNRTIVATPVAARTWRARRPARGRAGGGVSLFTRSGAIANIPATLDGSGSPRFERRVRRAPRLPAPRTPRTTFLEAALAGPHRNVNRCAAGVRTPREGERAGRGEERRVA